MDDKSFFRASVAREQRGWVTLDFDLTAGLADRVVNSPGTLFYLDKTSTGICTVEGSVDQGTTMNPLLASPGFSLFNEAGFSGFRINASAQPGKTLRVVIGSGITIKPGDPVSSGSIATQTVDAGLVRSLNGQAFLGTANNNAPVAAQNPNVELWNPAASGKSVIVESVSFATQTAQTVVLGDSSTALATLMANGSVMSKQPAGAVGTSAGKAEVRYTNQVGAPIINSIGQYLIAANIPNLITFKEPVVLLPGRGLLLYGVTVNTYLLANFEWFEA